MQLENELRSKELIEVASCVLREMVDNPMTKVLFEMDVKEASKAAINAAGQILIADAIEEGASDLYQK